MTEEQLAELISAIRWAVHIGVGQIITVQLILFFWGRKSRT